MNTLGQRLKYTLKIKGIKASFLAEKINVSQSTISFYVGDRSFPNQNFFTGLKELLPEINLDWLITGSGQMFLSETASSDDVKDLKSKLTDLQIREKQLTDTIIRMGSMLGTGAVGQGDRSKSKGVFNPGNWAYKRTVINTPWLA